ncbi:twin-arginine translocase TatA/TatE family subunit [Chloroflexota bacterium]
MDIFGMGMGEILLILVLALIIWGPERVVEVGRTLGKVARTLKKASFDLTSQISKELEVEEKDRPPQLKVKSGDKPKKSPGTNKVEPGDTEEASPESR